MITFPNHAGHKQETYVFPTLCPNEHNVCLPSLCEHLCQHKYSHKHVHLSDMLICVGGASSL